MESLVLGGLHGINTQVAASTSQDFAVPQQFQGRYVRILVDQPVLVDMKQQPSSGALPAFVDVSSTTWDDDVPEVILANIPEHRVIPRSSNGLDMMLRIRNTNGQSPVNLRLSIMSDQLY